MPTSASATAIWTSRLGRRRGGAARIGAHRRAIVAAARLRLGSRWARSGVAHLDAARGKYSRQRRVTFAAVAASQKSSSGYQSASCARRSTIGGRAHEVVAHDAGRRGVEVGGRLEAGEGGPEEVGRRSPRRAPARRSGRRAASRRKPDARRSAPPRRAPRRTPARRRPGSRRRRRAASRAPAGGSAGAELARQLAHRLAEAEPDPLRAPVDLGAGVVERVHRQVARRRRGRSPGRCARAGARARRGSRAGRRGGRARGGTWSARAAPRRGCGTPRLIASRP